MKVSADVKGYPYAVIWFYLIGFVTHWFVTHLDTLYPCFSRKRIDFSEHKRRT